MLRFCFITVVTIHHADISCEKLQKALFLLGTYYNLFVVVDGSDSSLTDEMKEDTFIKKIRSELLQNDENASEPGMVNMYKLNSQILPPHRIVFSTTSAGRVAFVRQLHGAELVVDGNEKVATELERFGFRVIVYPNAGSDGGSTSALGRVLIP